MTGASLRYLIKEGFRNTWTNRMMSIASICVLMSCLVLIGSASMIFLNMDSLLSRIEEENVIMVYIKDDANQAAIDTMGQEIKALGNVKELEYVPKEKAWAQQLETMEDAQAKFFTQIFRTYSSVLFCCAAGIIWLCRPVMHVMKSNYYYAWHFVPFLVLASTCSCFNQFMNSVYVVTKKSQRSMVTMMAGAISNCIMNYFFIKLWGPVGATYASFLGLALVFTLRAVDARRMIGMRVHPARVLANAAALVFEAFVLLAEPPLYGLWTGLITLVIILYNFAGVWAMARVLLPRLLGRRGKALVAAVDGWLKPKKA